MKILIIDDKEEARYLLEILLINQGYDVISSINGKEALAILEKAQVDLIISDILMPEMDGFKFCRTIKENEFTQNIPFIFYTATYVEKKDEEFALSLGADLFLRKPMPPKELLEEIEKMITKIKQKDFHTKKTHLQPESEMYKLYNERLIKKLEDKVDQLQKEIGHRKQIELKLQRMVEEKEILLRELYHRTRNNMQVICSMLKLYSIKMLDKKWWKMVQDIQTKIKTIALVHQKLYESDDLSHVNLKEYFETLIQLVRHNYDEQLSITINTSFEPIRVLLDTAIPLGFIVNELLTNSFEHGYPDCNKATITITLSYGKQKEMILTLKDDGIGLPKNFSLSSKENLGLLLLSETVTKQLQGKVEYVVDKGTFWKITIFQEQYQERI